MEVDEKTIKKEHLIEGRMKVLIDNTSSLPASIPIWVEEVKYSVHIEIEKVTESSTIKCYKEKMRLGNEK